MLSPRINNAFNFTYLEKCDKLEYYLSYQTSLYCKFGSNDNTFAKTRVRIQFTISETTENTILHTLKRVIWSAQ